jgi:hypothetical protein
VRAGIVKVEWYGNELDKKIEHYRKIAFSLNDQLTVDRIKALVAQLEGQKKALHPRDRVRPPQLSASSLFGGREYGCPV